MYKAPKKGKVPAGLAAYQERLRREREAANYNSYSDDSDETMTETSRPAKRPPVKRTPPVPIPKRQPAKRPEPQYNERLIEDYEMKLFKLKEKEKNMKKTINKLKKDM